MALIWLMVAVRSLTADDLVVRNTRRDSTSPSAPFGAAVARPESTASAAEYASKVSVLPRLRRSNLLGRLTSRTVIPAAVISRVTAAP